MNGFVDQASIAIRFSGVGKVYRLYSNQREAVSDRLGLYKIQFWRPPPQFTEFTALKGIDLTIRRGERIGLIGRNGAGKTTLLKLATRNFEPTQGEVEVNGSVQAIMQAGLGFHPDFTGYENIKAALVYNGLAGKDLVKAIEEVCEFVELGDFINQPMFTYSQGMTARLQFAVATSVRPDILIIDEVMGAGDAYFSIKSAERMRRLASAGSTLLLVTHSMGQIMEFCHRVVWLKEGAVVADGEAERVIAAYDNFVNERVATKGIDTGPAPQAIDLAGYAKRSFLRDAILQDEPVDLEREAELEDRLSDGLIVHRWPTNGGLKFSRVGWTGQQGGMALAKIGDNVSLELSMSCERPDDYEVMYTVLLYRVDGLRAARIDSPVDRFRGLAGQTRNFKMTITPLLLGAGDYLISLGIFDRKTGGALGLVPRNRRDFLSRSLSLKIAETNDTDPPVINYPTAWHLGSSSEAVVPKVTGWI